MSQDLKPYDYLAKPDGEDALRKLWYVVKPATAIGLGLSTVDVMCYSLPKGYLATLGRYAAVTFPVVAVSSTFVVITNMAGSIRKKDDSVNWFLGGLAAGCLLGAFSRNYLVGTVAGLAFGSLAAGRKVAYDNNFQLWPEKFVIAQGGVTAGTKYDYTVTKERPRNWTTGEN